MNRFEFTPAALTDGEAVVVKHESVKIYDGHEKVSWKAAEYSAMFSILIFRLPSKTEKLC